MAALLVKPCSVLCASSTVLCTYACAVCASDNDGAIVEPTQSIEPRCDHPQCFILEKLKPPRKSDLVRTRKTENLNLPDKIIIGLMYYS